MALSHVLEFNENTTWFEFGVGDEDYWSWGNSRFSVLIHRVPSQESPPPSGLTGLFRGRIWEYSGTVLGRVLLEVFLTSRDPKLMEFFKQKAPKSALERISGDLF